MRKIRWLTILGVLSVIVSIFAGQTISSEYGGFRIPFMVIGVTLSFIVIGLGEILYYFQNRTDEDNEKKDEDK